MSTEQRTTINNLTEATLQFLWNTHNVSIEHQHAFAVAGCTTIQVFKGLVSSHEDLRACLQQELMLSPTTIASRVAIANIVGAWTAAWERIEADNKVKAEARAAGGLQPATTLELTAMANIYKDTVLKGERLAPSERPSKSYLGRKMAEIEDGELEVESLEEVTSKADGEELDILHESLDSAGKRKLIRKPKRVPAPKDIPELQERHRIMAHCHGYLKTKQVSVAWLQTSTLAVWESFTRFLSGEKCYKMRLPYIVSSKEQAPKPDWSLVLHYEHELRKKGYRADPGRWPRFCCCSWPSHEGHRA